MSKSSKKQHQVYFMSTESHKVQLDEALRDLESSRSLMHDYSSPGEEASGHKLHDICEYYMLLRGYVDLLKEISALPAVPGETPETEDYVMPPEQMLLMKFYVNMCAASMIKLKGHGLSLLIN